VFSTVFLCLGYTHTLAAQDRSQSLDKPRLFDSRLDLIAPERLDPHRGETVLWGVGQENAALRLQQQFAELAELLEMAQTADDDEQVTAIKQKLMHLAQQKMQLDRIRSANDHGDTHQRIRIASKTKTGSEERVQPAPQGPDQIRALHEAAERLQNSGLKEMAHELRQRAEKMEKEFIVHREQMERAQQEMIAQKEQLERERRESELDPQNPERRLHELSEQVESLQRSVKELSEKMNHILELLHQQQAQAK